MPSNPNQSPCHQVRYVRAWFKEKELKGVNKRAYYPNPPWEVSHQLRVLGSNS